MKKYLLIVSFFIAAFANAQSWTPINGRTRFNNGLGIPVGDTALFKRSQDTSLLITGLDGNLYYRYKNSLIKINGGSGTGTLTSIATTYPIQGGPITTTGTISIDTTKWHSKGFYDPIYQPTGSYLTSIDTGNISSFYSKVRSLFSFSPGSGGYNNTNGVITIPTNTNQLTNGAGFLTGNQNITLSSDVSGTGTTAISSTVNGLKGVALPALSTGFLKYNGIDWVFDNSAYQASLTGSQGDLLYFSATNTLSNLAKNTTATRYLSNTGTSNNPAWAQVNLTNGVTGTLPINSGGTGQTTANAALNALLPAQTGNSGKFLTTDGSNTSWANASTQVGTYATKIAVSSPTIGQSFYQTNALEGLYSYDGYGWQWIGGAKLMYTQSFTDGTTGNQFGTFTSGSGASVTRTSSNNYFGNGLSLSTGTTSSGNAGLVSLLGTRNVSRDTGAYRYFYHTKIITVDSSISTDRFIIRVGVSAAGANTAGDQPGDWMFTYCDSINSGNWTVKTRNTAGTLINNVNSGIAFTKNTSYDFLIVENFKNAYGGDSAFFYINNTLVVSESYLNLVSAVPPLFTAGADFAAIVKTVGTTSKTFGVKNKSLYVKFINQ